MEVDDMLVWAMSVILMVSGSIDGALKRFDHGIRLPTTRPINIAHRGSSGIYPEHSVAAYEQAIRDGADFLECDMFITKDLHLICLHDPYLNSVTDVEDRSEFADRKRIYNVPELEIGEIDNWFSNDFTLEELRTLKLKQRFDFRNQEYNGKFNIPTFDEFVAIAKSAGRPIGIYPELKVPEFANSLDIMSGNRFEDLLLDSLRGHGYSKPDDLCFIQSFTESALRYLSDKTDLKLVMLVWRPDHYQRPDGSSKIHEWGSIFYGIGFWKPQVALYYNADNLHKNWITGQSNLVNESREAGLKVHLYTFRNEDHYLPWDFDQDPAQEYAYFMKLEIDAYFTDFPGTFARHLDAAYAEDFSTNIMMQNAVCDNAVPWRAFSDALVIMLSSLAVVLFRMF